MIQESAGTSPAIIFPAKWRSMSAGSIARAIALAIEQPGG
jgi:hypothetical protein